MRPVLFLALCAREGAWTMHSLNAPLEPSTLFALHSSKTLFALRSSQNLRFGG